MIEKIIRFSINNKIVVGIFVMALIVIGIFSLRSLPIDAVPDITNNQVQIISVAPTLAANEVEQLITSPIETSLANIPDQVELRSISRLGLSVVTIVFKENVDIYWARQQITERLKEAEEQIPPGLTEPELAPISTGLSEIFQYVLRVKPGYESQFDAMKLRTIQDWIVRREMLGTPGVADVNSYGGFLQQYEVAINPERLCALGLSLTDVFSALEKNNQNTGSAYVEKNPQAYFIRGLGLVSCIEDIEKIPVAMNSNGIPILIRDVAEVHMGYAPRYGAFIVDTTGEAVGGVVMMLKGKNASEVIGDVKERIELIQTSLPEGVYIDPYYDRTILVNKAVGTVSRNLIEGGLIVIFILVLLLGNLRAGLVVASVIPLSMLFAITLMNLFGVSGNLMSLGAIDFGLIVDGAVIIVESVVHRISHITREEDSGGGISRKKMDMEVISSAKRMMNSATFGQIIILIVYIPILALVGTEGKMFRPMAETVSFAIIGALILSLTYVPVASALFLSRKKTGNSNWSDYIMRILNRVFNPLLEVSLKHKLTVLLVSVSLFIGSIFLFSSLGGEFIPTLDEGDLAAGVMTLQGGSLSNTIEVVEKANKILMSKFPEVEHVVCKIGTGEIPTDPTPMETGDYIIVMKEKSEWTSASSTEEMMEKMQDELSALKGVVFTLQQPIQMRFNELMTGSKQDVAVKIFGDNLDVLSQKAEEVRSLIADVDGVTDINVESVTGSGQVQINYNRDALAQYGLNIQDINMLLKTAFAGTSAGVVYEDERRFDLVVRYDKDYRQDIDAIKNLYIPLSDGRQISLDKLADIQIRTGVAQVSRESAHRRVTVSFNVRGRDVKSVIGDIKKIIDAKLKMPPGYYVTYGGQFENLDAANKRLMVAVPVALLLIFILLYFTFGSLKQTALIYSAVPLAMIGGVAALALRGMNFSISAGVGFIALFGVAVLNGIVLIAEFNRLEKEAGMDDIYARVRQGIKARLRPVIMTALVASLGFLPMAISTSAGAEVQKPLATVVIGGLISSTLLTLVVLPVLYILFSRKREPGKPRRKHAPVVSVFLFVFLMAGLSNNTRAQNEAPVTFTCDQAVEKALSDNGYIRSASMNTEMTKKLRTSGWNIESTDVDIEYGQTNSFVKDNSISVLQPVSFLYKGFSSSKLACANVRSAELQQTAAESAIACDVRSAYYNLAYHQAVLSLLLYHDSLYNGFLAATELRLQNGEGTLLEQLTVQTRSMELKSMIEQSRSDVDIASQKLKTLVNSTVPVFIADKTLQRIPYEILPDTSLAANNPSLAIAKQQVEIKRVEKQVERTAFLPDVAVGYFNQSNKDLSANDRFTGFQVGISVPLLFFSQASKAGAAVIGEKMAQNDFEYYSNVVKNDWQSAFQEYMKQKSALEYYESRALGQADLIIEQAGKSYSAGEIGYLEYVMSLERAIEIRSGYLNTLNNYNQAVINIERVEGKIK